MIDILQYRKKLEGLDTIKRCENRNPNDYFTRKSIKTVARCQICKICFHTTFIGVLIILSHFVYGYSLTVHYSNCVLLMSVQQQTYYLFILLRKFKLPNVSYLRLLVTTPVLQ